MSTLDKIGPINLRLKWLDQRGYRFCPDTLNTAIELIKRGDCGGISTDGGMRGMQSVAGERARKSYTTGYPRNVPRDCGPPRLPEAPTPFGCAGHTPHRSPLRRGLSGAGGVRTYRNPVRSIIAGLGCSCTNFQLKYGVRRAL